MMFNKNNPIRLIELFAGIGSQAKALKNLGINFEHWCICEFDESAVKAYNAVHGTTFEPSDITKITAKNLNIHDTDHFTYLLVPLPRFIKRRERYGYGKRKRNKKWFVMGS